MTHAELLEAGIDPAEAKQIAAADEAEQDRCSSRKHKLLAIDSNYRQMRHRQLDDELIAEHERSQTAPTEHTFLERMRWQKKAAESADYADGKAAGVDWARDDATYQQLTRLEDWLDGALNPDFIRAALSDNRSGLAACDNLAAIITGDDDQIDAFDWTDLGDNESRHDSPDFVFGFAEGAIEAFREIADQIDAAEPEEQAA